MDRPTDAGALHRESEPGQACGSGMEKIEAYDQMENIADLAMPIDQSRIVTFESNRREKILRFQRQVWGVVRSEDVGLSCPFKGLAGLTCGRGPLKRNGYFPQWS